MFRWIVAICLILLAATLAGYSLAGGNPRADFVYVNSSGIHTLDPARMSWTPDIRVAINIWEGLTTYDPQTTQPREGVAHFPPQVSPDGLVYTFTLRPEARWSNGDPVTAGDFVRAWRRVIEPGTAGDYAFFITDHVAGAREYYDWRNHNVAILTALDRLARGWEIDEEAGRLLIESGAINELADPAATPQQSAVQRIGALDQDRREHLVLPALERRVLLLEGLVLLVETDALEPDVERPLRHPQDHPVGGLTLSALEDLEESALGRVVAKLPDLGHQPQHLAGIG